MSAPETFPVDAIITPALGDVLRERARAVVDFGHDAAADDSHPLERLGHMSRAFMQIAAERATGPSNRRILPGARKKAVQAVAMGLAFIDAIDRAAAREASQQED